MVGGNVFKRGGRISGRINTWFNFDSPPGTWPAWRGLSNFPAVFQVSWRTILCVESGIGRGLSPYMHDGGSKMLGRGLSSNVVGWEEYVAMFLLSNISTVVLEGSVAT